MHAASVRRVLSVMLVVWFGFISTTSGADWPQWRGSERTGVSKETGLLKSWPKDGPKLDWKISDAGNAYSGPAIANGLLFTMGNRDDSEFVVCYDVSTGKEKWAIKNGKAYSNSYGDGPRCTPTVDGDVLYALGANGDLCCLKTKDGGEVWRLNILTKFKGGNIGWGISESPLVDGDNLIVTPGGQDGTLVALNKKTGATVWTSKDPENRGREAAGYASPIAFTVDGVRQYATFTSKGGIGVRAKDGKFLWRYDKAANGTANVSTPIFHDNGVFFSSDYNTGCGMVQVKADGPATEAYFNRDMKNHHGGVVLLGDYLYGFNSGNLTCMKWADGSVAWTNRSVGKGSLCYADGCLYVLSEGGTMALVEATPVAYKEISKFKLADRSQKPSWSHPVVANGKLYIRDQETIQCFEVSAK